MSRKLSFVLTLPDNVPEMVVKIAYAGFIQIYLEVSRHCKTTLKTTI